MILFEVASGKFINMENVFKFELLTKKDSSKLFWRFYSQENDSVTSKEFNDAFEAITWLNMSMARADGAREVITL